MLFAIEHIPILSLPSKNSQPYTEGGETCQEWKNFKETYQAEERPGLTMAVEKLGKRDWLALA